PEIISCPDCGRQLRVPDHLYGKKVRCPGCKVMFRAEVVSEPPAPSPPPRPARKSEQVTREPGARRRRPAEEEFTEEPVRRRRPPREEEYEEEPDEQAAEDQPDEEEDDRSRARREAGPGWAQVRLGLLLMLCGFGVILVAFVVNFIGGMVAGASAGPTF